MNDITQPANEPANNSVSPTSATASTVVAAPSQQPATFWDYIKGNVPNHLKVLAIIALIGGVWYAFNTIRDLRAQLADQQQITSTLSQKFQTSGPAAVSGNSIAPAPVVQQQASDAFGPALLQLMESQGSQINSLTTAIGMTNAQVTALAAQQKTPFTPQQQTATTGQLTGYQMDESRIGAPPLASVDLFYNPAEHDPTKAFAGTTWTHNQEKFQTSIGEWVKGKDGGLSTSLSLQRTVSKPDPLHPGQMIDLGKEDIPITGSNTVFTPTGITAGAPLVIPRWTLGLGLTKTVNLTGGSGTTPAISGIGAYGSLDYRVTNRYGVFLGTANNGVIGGVSIRLDSK